MTGRHETNLEVWKEHAQQWQQMGAPLRPITEDGDIMLAMAESMNLAPDGDHIVVMGVTPEVVQLSWPHSIRLTAIDHSEEMIAALWSPPPAIMSEVKHASWQAMPVESGSVGLVVGDGCLTVLPGLKEYKQLFREVHRIVKPGGGMILRCFVRPDTIEGIDTVKADAISGQIASFHALKWRLAMALAKGASFTVAVSDVYKTFCSCFPDRALLARRTGWAIETINTIDAYSDVLTTYTFPTHDVIREIAPPFFTVADIQQGHYELSERCPTILFKPA